MKAKIIYTLCSCAIGLILCILEQSFLTDKSLVESLLLSSGSFFLIFKFTASSIITKYQDSSYQPSPKRRIWESAFVQISFAVVQPICMNFLYACTFLLFIKWMNPSWSTPLANWIYNINRLNEENLKIIISVTFTILAGLTYLEYISAKHSVRTRKLIIKLTYPLKIIAIVACFVHLDKVIGDKFVNWKMNNEPIKTESEVTFNAGEQKDRAEAIQQISDLYVEVLADQVSNTGPMRKDTSSAISSNSFYGDLQQTLMIAAQYPFIEQDMISGNVERNYRFGHAIPGSDETSWFSDHRTWKETTPTPDVKDWSGANAAFADTQENINKIFSILTDEKQSIRNKEKDINRELYEDVEKDYLGYILGLNPIDDNLNIVASAKEQIIDFIKDKAVRGIESLFKKKKISRADVQEALIYDATTTGNSMNDILDIIASRTTIMNEFLQENNKAFQIFTEDLKLKDPMFESLSQVRTIEIQLPGKNDLNGLLRLFSDFPHYRNEILQQRLLVCLQHGNSSGLISYNVDFWKHYSFYGGSPDIAKAVHPIIDNIEERQREFQEQIDHIRNGSRLSGTINGDFNSTGHAGADINIEPEPIENDAEKSFWSLLEDDLAKAAIRRL